MSAREAARELAQQLVAAGVPDAQFDAELLVRDAANLTRAELFAGAQVTLEASERLALAANRRIAREPAAYIRGYREFWGMQFAVGLAVLVPRPETELLVEIALREARPGDVVADIGTGSGALAVAVARELPSAHVVGTELDADALEFARANAAANGADVSFVMMDLASGIARADIVLANLPYIPTNGIDALEPEVSQWEPRVALDGGPDGFELIRRLVDDCAQRLHPRLLALEVGFGQAGAVRQYAEDVGARTEVEHDLQAIERVVICRWP